MLLGQRHGGVEADDRELPRDVQDGLDHRFAHGRVQVVELRGVVPREAGAVVAVVHVPRMAIRALGALEHDRGVAAVVVVVLDLDRHVLVVRQVGPVEGVGRERGLGRLQEPVGMFDHPVRIDTHVIGHHVAGELDAARERTSPQPIKRSLTAEIPGDRIA